VQGHCEQLFQKGQEDILHPSRDSLGNLIVSGSAIAEQADCLVLLVGVEDNGLLTTEGIGGTCNNKRELH
jgi:hypothetical protein